MANQVQIPYIQTSSDINQVQQNINKVLRNVYNQLAQAQELLDSVLVLGEVKFSPLSLAQFQSEAGTTWVLANGQSCVDTDYSKLTNNRTVPNISLNGVNAFIKVNNS